MLHREDRKRNQADPHHDGRQPQGGQGTRQGVCGLAVKALLDRKAAGINAKALLEARAGATDDDRILIAESNARKLKRFNQIAKDSGVALEAVQKRSAKKLAEKIPAGSGVWLQAEDGSWSQK